MVSTLPGSSSSLSGLTRRVTFSLATSLGTPTATVAMGSVNDEFPVNRAIDAFTEIAPWEAEWDSTEPID